MAYSQDLSGAARRHFASATVLHADSRTGNNLGSKAVAGYLYGLAGELALKELMRDSGMRPLDASQRRDDPFYAHFPVLKTLLRDNAKGRRDGELRKYSNDQSLFANWNTDMRYAPTIEIRDEWTNTWKTQAQKLIDNIGI